MSEKSSVPSYLTSLPTPPIIHRQLTCNETPKRLIVVGDVHGCYDELKELLESCNYQDAQTQVLIVGDLINKGPKSAEVVRFAKNNNFLCIRGNHDDFILAAIFNLIPNLKQTDAIEFIKQLTSEEVDWLKELPYTIRIPKWNAVFVHAGLIPNLPLESQDPVHMTTLRNVYSAEDNTQQYFGTSKTDVGVPWVTAWDESDHYNQHVYFGHDAKRGLQLGKFATGLDTGCLYGKKLSAMILPSRELVQIAAKQEYVQVDSKDL